MFKGGKPNISHLKVFRCKCFILNNGRDNLGKFDSKADEGFFLGYSLHNHAYRAYNKRTMLVEESVHIAFDETNQNAQEIVKTSVEEDDLIEHKNSADLQNKPKKTTQLQEN